ncbi:hypothetical protein LK540_13465 [Massilia sp. IC2-278]|uniref:hypothetical protein n=1 Tax=Massilia sp. IC2-278 TaxID=2887200 RepID=UPI001E3A4D9E|nr:hypothetical protein [Massilia sp. IC2-278]MCC2961432.1 hypothetical protein [Massilia sp. IC2-278]
MDFSTIRPILGGLAGAAVAVLIVRAWKPWVPTGMPGKSPDALLRDYRAAIRTANLCLLAGLLVPLALYGVGAVAHPDWRPLAAGVGTGCLAALLALALLPRLRGGSAREAFVAFAISQGAPLFFLYGVLGIGALLLPLGVTHFIG